MEISSAIFSKKFLLQIFSSLLLLGHRVFSFLLHQMEKENGEDEGGGNDGQLTPFGSLVGAPY